MVLFSESYCDPYAISSSTTRRAKEAAIFIIGTAGQKKQQGDVTDERRTE